MRSQALDPYEVFGITIHSPLPLLGRIVLLCSVERHLGLCEDHNLKGFAASWKERIKGRPTATRPTQSAPRNKRAPYANAITDFCLPGNLCRVMAERYRLPPLESQRAMGNGGFWPLPAFGGCDYVGSLETYSGITRRGVHETSTVGRSLVVSRTFLFARKASVRPG